jgi:iron complex outermembrane receptor protein
MAQEEAAPEDTAKSNIIIVTARKVEQDVLDVPLSMTVVSSEALTRSNTNDILSLQQSAPGLQLSNSGNDPRIITRGAGVAGTNDIAVPIFVDSSYRPRSSQALASYLDVERIEFLRGPQGTLFGRNTLGGLLNIIPKRPELGEFDFGGAFTYGNYDARRLEGFVNVAVGDTLALRITGSDERRDPFVKNTFNPDGGLKDADSTYARAQILFEPSSDFSIRAGYAYWKDTANGNSDFGYKTLGIPVNLSTQLTNGVTGVIDPRLGTRTGWEGGRSQAGNVSNGDVSALVLPSPYEVAQDYEPQRRIKEDSFFVDINLDALSHHWQLTADYFDYSELRLTDSDQSSNSALVAGQLTNSKAKQLDFHFNSTHDLPIQYTLGFYFYDDSDPGDSNSAFLWGYTSAAAPQEPAWAYWLYQNNGGTKSTAFYGQAEYSLTDKLKVSGGLRTSKEQRKFFVLGVDQSSRGDILPSYSGTINTIEGTDTNLDWRAGAQYDFSDAILLYGYAATAYIAGGIQQGNTGQLLDPNEVFTWEIGAKGRLLDDSLTYNIAYYNAHYKGLTTTIFIPQGGTILAQSVPGGDTKASGVEFEASWSPVRGASIDVGMTIAKSEFGEFNVANRFTEGGDTVINGQSYFVMNGKRTQFSPPVTFSLTGSYEIDLGSNGTLTPWARMYYSDNYRVTNDPYFWSEQDQFITLDASLGWKSSDGKISALLFGKNLTNEAYFTSGTVFSRQRAVVDYSNPRTYGIRLGYNF